MGTINIGLHGSSGRMGKAVVKAIEKSENKFYLVTVFSRQQNKSILLDFCSRADIVIDFSSPDALEDLLKIASRTKTKLVIGTTGLSKGQVKQINKTSKIIPILYSPNMSIGSNLIIEIAGKLSKILKTYDVEIIDIHHRNKKDSPSGTSIAIGKRIAKYRKQKFEQVAVFDRVNRGLRKYGEIGFSSIRSGEILGEHKVIFAGSTEVVSVGANALSREVFANGALFAASWLHSITKPGLYSIQKIFNF